MAYDEKLAGRVRAVLGKRAEFSERKMFGGVAFMVDAHMCCGIVASDLMVRVGADAYQEAVSRPHARPMDFTGRPSTGAIYVAPAGIRTARALTAWIERALTFVGSLPARAPRKRRKRLRRPVV